MRSTLSVSVRLYVQRLNVRVRIFRDYAGEIPGIMNVIIAAITVILAAVTTADEFCYNDVVKACNPKTNKQTIIGTPICNATYGGIEAVLPDLQRYANTHLARSFEFLLMSTHYANYEKNRAGFEKLFRDLSDSTWHDAIDLIKYMTKRGGQMNFSNRKKEKPGNNEANYELYELQSLAKALDMEKQLALDAFSIHAEATHTRKDVHDPEVSSYLEKEFVHRHAETVRQLSGHTADLTKMLSGPDASIALYLFDDYLQK